MYVSMEEEIDTNLGSPTETRGKGGTVNNMHAFKFFPPHFHVESSTNCGSLSIHLLVITYSK